MSHHERDRLDELEQRVVVLTATTNAMAGRFKPSKLRTFLLDGRVLLALLGVGASCTAGLVRLYLQAQRDHDAVAQIQGDYRVLVRNDERIASSLEQFCASSSILWAKRGETVACARTSLSDQRTRWGDR